MDNTSKMIPPKSNPKLAEAICALVGLAVELYQPKQILVFGSQARGDWREDSDIDLLIIEPSLKQVAGILNVESYKRRIRLKFDAVVAMTATINAHSNDPTSVYARALAEGISVYDKK